MLKRFVFAFLAFVGLIVPAALILALLMAPAIPAAPVEQPGCERNIANANSSVAALHARVKNIGNARAVIALCKTGLDRERELGRLDADVEHINEAIAERCS